jgi:hypothetical protein
MIRGPKLAPAGAESEKEAHDAWNIERSETVA